MMDAQTQHVLSLANAHGFAMCGIAPAVPSARRQEQAQWIGAGKHGEMHYLAEHLALKQDPRQLLDGAKSILVVVDAYQSDLEKEREHIARNTIPPSLNSCEQYARAPFLGHFAKYAFGKDYHDTLKKRLNAFADVLKKEFPSALFRATVDTAPIHEREVALLAGLGWIGKNTLLIHPRHGSFFLLGTLLTTLDLAPAPTQEPDHCAHCRKCIEACPTQAIAADGYSLDARRCVSYLTLEHRSEINPEFFNGMGTHLGGCDICQDVCPFNQIAQKHPLAVSLGHKPRPEIASGVEILEVLNWTEDDRRRVFQGSALKRMKLEMVKRNALIAAGNILRKNHVPFLSARIEALAQDINAHPLVQTTARAVREASSYNPCASPNHSTPLL